MHLEMSPSQAILACQQCADPWTTLPRHGAIRAGLRVRVCGLQARPDLNGLLGTVVEWDEAEARWKVRHRTHAMRQPVTGRRGKPAARQRR